MWILFSAKAGTDDWRADAITGLKEYVADEKTLAYMSAQGLRYMVQERDNEGILGTRILSTTIYEPDPELAERYWKERRLKVVEKAPDEFGRHRTALAELKGDGLYHLTYFNEPDLTYIVDADDLRTRFEEVEEKEIN